MADQTWCYFQKGMAHMAFLCTQLLLMLYIPRQTLRCSNVAKLAATDLISELENPRQ